MGTKNSFTNGQIVGLAGGAIAIISVFLPWFSAHASGPEDATSSISVNGLGSISGSGILLNFISGSVDWEFQGIGVLALGIAVIAIALFLRENIQSAAVSACGILIVGGGAVNLWSLREIGAFSGEILPGITIQSGIGYGLYVVVIAGVAAAAGGLMTRSGYGS